MSDRSMTVPLSCLLSRRLQEEEQQLRTSSLPAIPNPFPELCSPASSPVLSPGSLPPGEPSTGNYVSQTTQNKLEKIFQKCQLFRNSESNKTVNFLSQLGSCGFNILLCIIIWCGCTGYKTWSPYGTGDHIRCFSL